VQFKKESQTFLKELESSLKTFEIVARISQGYTPCKRELTGPTLMRGWLKIFNLTGISTVQFSKTNQSQQSVMYHAIFLLSTL
jgi:hypothetical protein